MAESIIKFEGAVVRSETKTVTTDADGNFGIATYFSVNNIRKVLSLCTERTSGYMVTWSGNGWCSLHERANYARPTAPVTIDITCNYIL
jgi:hypothetical protein